MKGKITAEGSFTIDGRVFRWAYDEADLLEVWNWQYGRNWAQLRGAEIDKLARKLALDLIANREDDAP